MSVRKYLSEIFGPEGKPCEGCGVQEGVLHLPGCAIERRVRYEDTENGRKLAREKPRLAAVRSAPSREEFAAWRDHPVTLFVFAAMRAVAEEQEQTWHDQSWHGGNCDPLELNGLRARADTYTSMEEGDYEAFCEWAGVQPEPLEGGEEWARG